MSVKKTESALRQSERQFRQFAEHVHGVFWIASYDLQQLIYANTAFETVWGRPLSEWYERPSLWLEVIHPEDKALFDKAYSVLLRDNMPMDLTYRIYRPDGVVRWVRDQRFIIQEETGNAYRQAGVASDVTLQKEAEVLARQHRMELEHIARIHSMGEMASTLAHELNQPLTAITSYVQGCVRRLEEGPAEHLPAIIQAMQKAAQYAKLAGDIIHRMKNFVRSGELCYETVSLNAIIQEAVAFMQDEMATPVVIELALADTLPWVMMDAIQMQQVLLNLLRNGVHATLASKKASSPIHVKTYLLDPHTVAVQISDQGEGIAPAVMDSLFKPYVTTKKKGMGMGLAICRTIVEAHGGQISVDTHPGRGTSFRFTLPVISEGALQNA